ncbi:MAG TPA: hypothetical protein DCZ72_04830 [Armatimonadetes bacterium]|nr:hypothetical protein [Armatimonadota bacterium]
MFQQPGDARYVCPRCDVALDRAEGPAGRVYVCPACAGRLVGTAVVRRAVDRKAYMAIWQAVQSEQAVDGPPCPVCERAMREVSGRRGQAVLTVDGCPTCSMLWFDAGELEQLPPPPLSLPPEPKDRPLPPAARQVIAEMEAAYIAQREATSFQQGDGPDEVWKYIPALLGMPVEADSTDLRSFPWVTVSVSVLIALVSILALASRWHGVVPGLTLVPANVGATVALTWFTHCFLHADGWHLVGNLYFLLLFGRRVEDALGSGRYALLLLGSAWVAGVVHMLFNWGDTIPVIGASGAVSGVLASSIVAWPNSRYMLFIGPVYWLRTALGHFWLVPAWVMGLLWLLLQGVHVAQWQGGYGRVAVWSHLGGTAAGVIAWAVWRELLAAHKPSWQTALDNPYERYRAALAEEEGEAEAPPTAPSPS